MSWLGVFIVWQLSNHAADLMLLRRIARWTRTTRREA